MQLVLGAQILFHRTSKSRCPQLLIDGDDEIELFYAFYVSVGWAFMSNFNSKSYLCSSMGRSLLFSIPSNHAPLE